MKTAVKFGIVIAGYGLALVGALAVVYINLLFTQNAQAQASAGMYAFGDLLLFLGVFGVLALVPSALAFYFLRPFKTFWNWFAVACLLFALTGPVIAIANGLINATVISVDESVGLALSLIGILHVFASPLLCVGFLILAVVAPAGRSRLFMLVSAGAEIVTGAYALVAFSVFKRLF